MSIVSRLEIAPTKAYPPEREQVRIRELDKFWRYRSGQFGGLVPEVEGPLRLNRNAFRFVSNFWRDTIMADAPMITLNGTENTTLNRMMPWIYAAMRNVIENVATYGYGVFVNRRPLRPESIDSRYYFPIRAPYDENEGDEAIIAYPYAESAKNYPDSITIEYYSGEMGRDIEHRSLNGMVVGNIKGTPESTFGGRPIPVIFGEGAYGKSMYADIEKSVAEIHRRENYISHALDRAADPHLAVPEESLRKNEQGQYEIAQEGMVIPVPDTQAFPAYVSWDAKFDSQYSQVDRAWRAILQDAAINPVLVSTENGTPLSGSAVRKLAVTTVNRAREIRDDLSEALIQLVTDSAALSGENISPESLEIMWPLQFSSLDEDEPDESDQ